MQLLLVISYFHRFSTSVQCICQLCFVQTDKKKCANASLDNLEKAPFWACKPGSARPWCSSYHALFTLDHQAFVPVHSADATDDIIVLVMRPPSVVTVVSLQGVRAVGLAGRLAHDLVDLDGSFVPSAVVSLPQAAHVSAH